MKPAYLFFWLCVAWALPGRAQTGFAWQHGYGTATRNERGGIAVEVPGPTGGFLIAGQQLLPGTAVRSQVFLVRTNGQGDTLWTRRFVPPLGLQPNPTGLTIDPQGNVLLTVSSTSSPTNAAFSHLIKFNPTCDIALWQNFYQPVVQPGVVGVSYIYRPLIAPDGNYLFMRTDATDAGQSVYFQTNLVKVSAATGAQIWNFDFTQYSLNQGFGNRVTVSEPAQYAGGLMFHVNLSNATFTVNADENLFINFAGAVASAKRNPNPSYPLDNFPVFKTLRDGNIVVGRRQKLYKISTAPATAGDTLWRTVAPPVISGREWDARDMVEDQNGDILLVGDSYFSPPGNPPTSRQIHLVRFSGSGVLQRDTILRRAGDNFVRSAILGPTGRDLIFSGYATAGIIGGEDIFMARYTGLRPLATAPGAASSSLRPRLTLYPNPAGGGAPVQAGLPDRRGGTLLVLDALGRQVARQAVGAGAGTASVPVAGLPPGVYVLRYAPAGGGPPATARLLRE